MTPSRRQFIRQCATVVGGTAVVQAAGRPSERAAADDTLVNWAGNYRYSTDNLHRATSVEDVQDSSGSTTR